MSVQRIFERLAELYAIGGGPGANRPHPSARRTRRTSWRRAGFARPASRSRSTLTATCSAVPGRPRRRLGRLASRHRSAGREVRRRAGRRRRDRGGRAGRLRLGRRVPRRGGRLHRQPRAVPLRGSAVGVPRAPHRAGADARAGRRPARRRHRHRRLRARRALVRWPCRSCGNDADARPRGRTRPCRDGDPQHPGRRPARSEGAVATVGELDVEPGGRQCDSRSVSGSRSTSVRLTASDWMPLVAASRPRARAACRAGGDERALPRRSPRRDRRSRPAESSSYRRAPVTTRASSPQPASTPGCSSSAA